jgi:hypothetical protein
LKGQGEGEKLADLLYIYRSILFKRVVFKQTIRNVLHTVYEYISGSY